MYTLSPAPPARRAASATLSRMVPLCEMRPSEPSGTCGTPTRLTPSGRLKNPEVLGPIRRTPCRRAADSAASCRRHPSSPVSANPTATATAPATPAAPQSASTSGNESAGVAMNARSTGSSMSVTAGNAGRPSTSVSCGLTG
jgi:hypothetical protein